MTESRLVKVYAFELYDIGADEMKRSRRMATREAIADRGGVVIEESVLEVDTGLVGGEVRGMTKRDFKLQRPPAFQSRVSPD